MNGIDSVGQAAAGALTAGTAQAGIATSILAGANSFEKDIVDRLFASIGIGANVNASA